MRTKKYWRHLLIAASLGYAGQACAQADVTNHNGGTGYYLGWNSSAPQALEVRHNGNFPIQWWTDSTRRMILSPTLTNQTVNGFTGLDLSGFLGIGNFNPGSLFAPHEPYAMLHLDDWGLTPGGYRPWMRTGTLITKGTDMAFFGMKPGFAGATHTVVAWCDNSPAELGGPDMLKFIFASHTGVSTGVAGTADGLEAARFLPLSSGNATHFGLGDWTTAATNPTERLDVLDGRVRIRKLPDDAEADGKFKVMVVDASNDLGERGVVKWVDPSNLPGASGCEWTLLGPPGSNSHIATAYTGNPGCPQMGKGVGIGVSDPLAKLDVRHQVFNQGLGRVATNATVVPNNALQPFTAITAAHDDISASTVLSSTGIGVFGIVRKARVMFGVVGESLKDFDGPSGDLVGVYGRARTGAYTNYAFAAGVLGETDAPNATNSWAGYFRGNVNVQGGGYYLNGVFIVSDAQFKTNVQPLEDPLGTVMQLQPHRYDLLSEEYPQLNFSTESQVGLIAQELEEVIPGLVSNSTIAAALDTLGQEVSPQLDYKAVNYAGLVPYLIGAVQQQQATIAQLQQQIAACCAANPGMAPQDGTTPKQSSQAGELKEQRLRIIPNPVAELTTLEYDVPMAGRVSLVVGTIDGKPLGTLREEQAEAGAYSYTWNTGQLAAGTYLCTYLLNGAVVVQRAVKVR